MYADINNGGKRLQKVSRKKGRKRSKKNNKRINTGLLFLLFLLVSLVPLGSKLKEIAANCDYLKIKQIKIEGNKKIDIEKFKTMSGLNKDMNILDIDLDLITSVAGAEPWIKSVEVERQFPDSVHIQIEESSPVAIWREDGKDYAIDEYGILLEEIEKGSVSTELPIITGKKVSCARVGDICPSPFWSKGLEGIKSVKNNFPSLMEQIALLHILTEDQMLILLKNNSKIFLTIEDADIKLIMLQNIIRATPQIWRNMQYCDLRFKDKIIFG